MALTVSQRTDRGHVRPRNEDALAYHSLSDDGGRALLVVADGMGGHSSGDIASDIAVRACCNAVQARITLGDPPMATVREAVEVANRAVLQAQVDSPSNGGMGTTLTSVLIWDGRVYVGHCGDSRAYLISRGEAVQLTSDHSVVGELVKGGQISQDEAMVHPQRNLLTQALGMREELSVEAVEAVWQPGDILLLCTDGLTNMVRTTELQQEIARGEFDVVADRLIDLANSRGGPDNITVLAARWEG